MTKCPHAQEPSQSDLKNIPEICNKDYWWQRGFMVNLLPCQVTSCLPNIIIIIIINRLFSRDKETHGNTLRFEIDSLLQCRVNVKHYSSKPLYKAVVLYKLLSTTTRCHSLTGSVWTLHTWKTRKVPIYLLVCIYTFPPQLPASLQITTTLLPQCVRS